jgi:hypothetical protein
MRMLWVTLTVLVGAEVAVGQDDPRVARKPVVRYGVTENYEFYPQGTAKDALATAARVLENQRYEYLVAHLIDPAVVDAKVAERAAALEGDIEKGLAAVREEQRRNPRAVASRAEMLPLTPDEFSQRVKAEAEKRAFAAVVRAVADNLGESPENVRLLAKFARDGVAAEGAGGVTVTLKDVPAKKVFLKQVGNRWFVEDRQQEADKPAVAR